MFNKKVKTVIKIDGMSCEHCVNKVKENLEKVPDILKVKVDLKQKQAIIISIKEIDYDKVKEIITNLGYKVVGV